MTRDFDAVVASLRAEEGVRTARRFGAAGLDVGGKVFAMHVKGALVVKVPEARARELVAAGLATPFDPGHGRVMKAWVRVPPDAAVDWVALAREAWLHLRGAP